MDYAPPQRRPAPPATTPARNAGVAGPRGATLTALGAALNKAPVVQRLASLSGVIQRVVVPNAGDLNAAKQRLLARGVPNDVVENYHALTTTHTEDEVALAHAGANAKAPMQSSFPKLVHGEGNNRTAETDLIFRGMSVNNIRNLQQSAQDANPDQVIFNAQNPVGDASAVEHIVDDHPNSPYLSFEAGGANISTGKYAPKPIGHRAEGPPPPPPHDNIAVPEAVAPDDNKPRGLRRGVGGFIKQKPSYTGDSRRDYPDVRRVGYVGGVNPAGLQTLDVSTVPLANQLVDPDPARQADARRIAVNDREVLLTPGPAGVPRSQVPFVSKVKQVTREYYHRKRNRQTPEKSLGYFKPAGSTHNPPQAGNEDKTKFYKVQIPPKYAQPDHHYGFDIPAHHRKQDDDDGSDISDVESVDMNLDDERDFSDDEGAGAAAAAGPVFHPDPDGAAAGPVFHPDPEDGEHS